ncbi:MAG TPA: pitrilysin family protein [Candidatus Krumholzibacteria bacterium]|nr:pitrilysin family protein [Candidatus Krumholzibacteria bacterium]
MKRLAWAFAFVAIIAASATAGYGKKDQPAGVIQYEEHVLDNGLRVVLSEDHSVPVVAVNVWYHVGSANEEKGRSGFAHLFEHMMFQGSENVGKGDHMKLVADAGGSMNGSTTQDRTNYFETLPSNRLNLGLWLEADRMRSLAITKDNFENQRETVKEERRQGIDNQPYGEAFLVSDTLGYDGWPYDHTVIGSMDDLNAAEVADVQAFFNQYYCPANAVLVIVGDIEPAKTMEMVKQYFGDIPAGTPSTFPTWVEKFNQGERRKVVDAPKANVPALFATYKIPGHEDPDTPALELLNALLIDGESSRLHKRLVKDEEAAFGVFGFIDGRLGPGQFRVIAASNAGVDIATCEKLMDEEIEKIKKDGITPEELEKVRTQFKSGFISNRQTVMNKAEEIHHYIRFHKDLAEINTDLDVFMKVTAEDIQRVANKYLRSDNRTLVIAAPPQNS